MESCLISCQKLNCFWQSRYSSVTSRNTPSTALFFPRPKQHDKTDHPSSGIVYKINCRQCDFVYYGQTERSLKMQVSEHKKAVLMFYENSKVVSHVHQCHHQMDFDDVKVVGHEPNNITINSFSLKLGCLWKIWTLRMTTSSQKFINVWHTFNLKLSQKHSYRSHSVIFNFK